MLIALRGEGRGDIPDLVLVVVRAGPDLDRVADGLHAVREVEALALVRPGEPTK